MEDLAATKAIKDLLVAFLNVTMKIRDVDVNDSAQKLRRPAWADNNKQQKTKVKF